MMLWWLAHSCTYWHNTVTDSFVDLACSFYAPFQISDRMAANEYVYIVCQNARTGKVLTVHDNRDQLEQDMMTNTDPSDNLINKFFFSNKKEGSAANP